jgi:hypothetical protein
MTNPGTSDGKLEDYGAKQRRVHDEWRAKRIEQVGGGLNALYGYIRPEEIGGYVDREDYREFLSYLVYCGEADASDRAIKRRELGLGFDRGGLRDELGRVVAAYLEHRELQTIYATEKLVTWLLKSELHPLMRECGLEVRVNLMTQSTRIVPSPPSRLFVQFTSFIVGVALLVGIFFGFFTRSHSSLSDKLGVPQLIADRWSTGPVLGVGLFVLGGLGVWWLSRMYDRWKFYYSCRRMKDVIEVLEWSKGSGHTYEPNALAHMLRICETKDVFVPPVTYRLLKMLP